MHRPRHPESTPTALTAPSSRRRPPRPAVAVALGLVALLAATAPAAAAGPPARGERVARAALVTAPADDGLRVEASTTYDVDLEDEVVRVRFVAELTNEMRNRVRGSQVEYFYFDRFGVPIPRAATRVRAAFKDGGSLRVDVEPSEPGFSAAVVRLSPTLRHGTPRTIELTYELRPQKPRSATGVQVNEAFATFPMYTLADPGRADVTLRAPAGLEVQVVGADMTSSTTGSTATWSATGIAQPDGWFARAVVRDDERLAERTVEHGEHEVVVRAWPDDDEWLEFTADLAERGLPALEATIGYGWDEPRTLTVVETSTPYVYGFAGWYEHSRSVIEVGDALEASVTLHEMAHAWFNEEAFVGRWINEALASEVAALAMEELDLERASPTLPDTGAPEAVALNDWVHPAFTTQGSEEREAYGYGTSWWVVHSVVEEIGAENLSKVLVAADERAHPYAAETAPSTRDDVPDWRAFLDLLEEVGGSDGAERLFTKYVVPGRHADLVTERREARTEYGRLVEANGGWAPPAVLRDAMAEWHFARAVAMLPQVEEVVTERTAIATALAAVDGPEPTALRAQIEGADDLDALEDAVADARAATDALVDALAAHDGVDPLARLGMVVVPADAELDSALAAYDDGAWVEAREHAGSASSGLTTARVVGGGAILLLLAAVAGGVVVLLRSRRTPRAEATVDEPTPDASPAP